MTCGDISGDTGLLYSRALRRGLDRSDGYLFLPYYISRVFIYSSYEQNTHRPRNMTRASLISNICDLHNLTNSCTAICECGVSGFDAISFIYVLRSYIFGWLERTEDQSHHYGQCVW